MTDLRHRALRLARRIEDGEKLFTHLTSRQSRDAMLGAVVDGVPPLSRLSAGLAERFPSARTLPARQLAGLAVRAVLSEEGYEVDRQQVRLRDDPLFAVAATFRRIPDPAPQGAEWVARLVSVMTRVEAGYALTLLRERLEAAP